MKSRVPRCLQEVLCQRQFMTITSTQRMQTNIRQNKLIQSIRIIGLSLLLIQTPLYARGRGPLRCDQGTPGQFEYYTWSASVTTGFCTVHPRKCSPPETEHILSLHGLWPSLHAAAKKQPAFCDVSPSVCALDQQSFDALPEIPGLNIENKTKLAQAMPSQHHLQRHEWYKHGSCSGLDANTYFYHAIAILDNIKADITPALSELAGPTVTPASLQAHIATRNPILANTISLFCETTPHVNQPVLVEIRLNLAKNADNTPGAILNPNTMAPIKRNTGKTVIGVQPCPQEGFIITPPRQR